MTVVLALDQQVKMETDLEDLHAATVSIQDIATALDGNLGIKLSRLNELSVMDEVDGWTPLNAACHHKNWEVASFLIERGANINKANEV
jgi:ankyrin repeat protein